MRPTTSTRIDTPGAITMNFRLSHTLISLLFAAAPLVSAQAQEKVLNLYSARHYQTDEALYNGFTQQT